MKTKTKPLIFFFFLILISGLVFIPNNAKADSFYNWIQNPSFVQYSNYIEYGDFENNEWEDGEVYGNWSKYEANPSYFSLTEPHTGQYSMRCSFPSNESFVYTFAEDYQVLGSEIEDFYLYFYSDSFLNFDVYIDYTDETQDTHEFTPNDDGEWYLIDILDSGVVSNFKVVESFIISVDDAGYMYIDDVVFMVDDGGGQDSVGAVSYPWFQFYWVVLSDLYTYGTSHDFGRLDDYSIYFAPSYMRATALTQDIGYLDSDTIHYVDFYVYDSVNEEIGITCTIYYSDGSTSSKTEYSSPFEAWTYINFGKSFIKTNSNIIRIQFRMVAEYDGIIYFDDIGLWSTVEFGYTRFDYTLTPLPTYKTAFQADVLMNTVYTFTGFIYNSTGGLSESGTYTFIDSSGVKNGVVTDGLFSVSMSKRIALSSFDETITIIIIINDEVINVAIKFAWYITPSGGEYEGTVTGDFLTNWFIYAIFLVVLPIAMTVYISNLGENVSSSLLLITFMGSETLMTAISLSIGLVNIWFMLVVIIVDVMIIFGLLKGRG